MWVCLCVLYTYTKFEDLPCKEIICVDNDLPL